VRSAIFRAKVVLPVPAQPRMTILGIAVDQCSKRKGRQWRPFQIRNQELLCLVSQHRFRFRLRRSVPVAIAIHRRKCTQRNESVLGHHRLLF